MAIVNLHKELDKEKLEALVEIYEKINKLEFEEMLEFIIHQTIETLGVKRCAIFKVFPEPEVVVLLAGEPKNEHGVGMKFSFKDLGAVKEVIGIKSYLLITEPWQDKRTWHSRELIYHRGINVILFVPILAQDEVIGVIVIDATGERKTFSEEEIYFCVILSNLVGVILERDLIHKEREEEKTLMLLGQAAAEAAHRLRNPLIVIGGFARRLAKLKDALCQDYASHIIKGADEMDAVISGLLRFSAPKKAELTETKINEVIKEVEKLIPESTGEKKIRVSLQLDSGIPTVLVDPTEIEDVFSLILRNAVESVEADGEILIKSKKEGNEIKVSITNTGGCIDEEILQEIFNPFFTTKAAGTGLGVATALATIKAYNGDIKVQNDQAFKLTTFAIKIPIPERKGQRKIEA
jgi:signal transduction histidine kinase